MSGRKLLCTLSVFIGTIAAFVGSCWIRLPDYTHRFICVAEKPHAETAMLPVWIILHVLFPAMVLCVAGMILYGWWHVSLAACAKLRGESAQ